MYHIFIICSSVDGHLGQVHFAAIVHGAAVDMDVQVSVLWCSVLSYMPRSGIAESQKVFL